MTIKQYGGVFGRNPTFNDVTIEGQLTFDGDIDVDSDLKVDGNLDVTGTSNLAAIAGTGNVVLGNTVTNPASNYATQQGFGWNNSTKVLEISSSAGALQLGRTSGGGDGQVLVIRQAANIAAEIRVEGNTGYFKPSNGGGIDFSATAGTGTSEILDDYEEGDWTPTLESGTGIGYTTQSGKYTKIGNLVYIDLYLNVSASSADASNVSIGGLPYAPVAISSYAACVLSVAEFDSTFLNVGANGIPHLNFLSTGSQLVLDQTYNDCNSSGKLRLAAYYRT